jgi:hypothetical protein
MLPSVSRAQGPVAVIPKEGSSIKFNEKASPVPIDGTFDKWDATFTFASTDATSGVLDVKTQTRRSDAGRRSSTAISPISDQLHGVGCKRRSALPAWPSSGKTAATSAPVLGHSRRRAISVRPSTRMAEPSILSPDMFVLEILAPKSWCK